MAAILNFNNLETTDLKIHFVPAEIQHNGQANVASYFESTIRDVKPESNVLSQYSLILLNSSHRHFALSFFLVCCDLHYIRVPSYLVNKSACSNETYPKFMSVEEQSKTA